MSEIIYTYNKYALNEHSDGEYIQYIGDVLLQDMRVQKYVSFCYTTNTSGGSTTEYYYGGFVWNESTEDGNNVYKDIYFVVYGVERKSNGDYEITNRHYYKCNVEDTDLKFVVNEDNNYGFVSTKISGNGTGDNLIFGINSANSPGFFFRFPPKSFFLEGDHQPFNDLKPGKYPLGAFNNTQI